MDETVLSGTVIHHCQALSSPVVSAISTIRAGFDQRHANIDGLLDRLREPLARASEANENLRRRMLDEKPLDESDDQLLSSFVKMLNELRAIQDEYIAKNGPSDLPDIPAFPENFGAKAKEIAEAIAIAVRVVKRPA
jgi:hypothetical protein